MRFSVNLTRCNMKMHLLSIWLCAVATTFVHSADLDSLPPYDSSFVLFISHSEYRYQTHTGRNGLIIKTIEPVFSNTDKKSLVKINWIGGHLKSLLESRPHATFRMIFKEIQETDQQGQIKVSYEPFLTLSSASLGQVPHPDWPLEYLEKYINFRFWEMENMGVNAQSLYDLLALGEEATDRVLRSRNSKFYTLLPDVMFIALEKGDSLTLTRIFKYPFLVSPTSRVLNGRVMKPPQFIHQMRAMIEKSPRTLLLDLSAIQDSTWNEIIASSLWSRKLKALQRIIQHGIPLRFSDRRFAQFKKILLHYGMDTLEPEILNTIMDNKALVKRLNYDFWDDILERFGHKHQFKSLFQRVFSSPDIMVHFIMKGIHKGYNSRVLSKMIRAPSMGMLSVGPSMTQNEYTVMLSRVIESYADFYKLDLSFVSPTEWIDILVASLSAGYSKAVKRVLSLGLNGDQKRLRQVLISNAPFIVQNDLEGLLIVRYRLLMDASFWMEFFSNVPESEHDKVWHTINQESPRLYDIIEPLLTKNHDESHLGDGQNSELLRGAPHREMERDAVGRGPLPLPIHRPRLPPLRALGGQSRRMSAAFPRLHV